MIRRLKNWFRWLRWWLPGRPPEGELMMCVLSYSQHTRQCAGHTFLAAVPNIETVRFYRKESIAKHEAMANDFEFVAPPDTFGISGPFYRGGSLITRIGWFGARIYVVQSQYVKITHEGNMTTPVHLADSRKQLTIEEADALFRELALREVQAKRKAAALDKKIAELKDNYDRETEQLRTELDMYKAKLAAYIVACPERFRKPRSRKTIFGTYGLKHASKLVISDRQAVIDFARQGGHDFCETKIKLKAKQICEAIGGGLEVPGARISEGDIASYKVDTAALDEEARR
ncbi:MAG: host-nuclease inhibitor Gam family protein [Victivallaceae bacterium]|nr:host-nuclease inhibitor Gam family protein [Victivallaceae bacterium]